MNKKKILLILIIILFVIILVLLFSKFLKKEKNITEITPGAEMTEEQERETIISLYYTNIETNTLMPEARVIDVKMLLENPYKSLVEFLLEKPKNEKLKSALPENTKVNDAKLEGDKIILDISKDFIENRQGNKDEINLSIYAIVNTLTELNEVNSVKILIDGQENMQFDGTDINLNNEFYRMN